MDLIAFMKSYADQIGGQYTEYDPTHSIIIVPVSGSRYQTVIGTLQTNELYNRKLIYLSSKVCPVRPDIDFRSLLEQAAHFHYARFVVKDHYLQMEAAAPVATVDEGSVKEMLQEVANLADQFELKLTGADIH